MVRGAQKQKEFATALGINANTLRNYESGRVLPNQEVLARICVQFSVSAEWLLLGSEPIYKAEPAAGLETTPPACSRCLELYERLYVLFDSEKKLFKENAELRVELERLKVPR